MDNKRPSKLSVSQKGGVVREVINQFKLVFRLMGDSRVNIFVKIIPVGVAIYLISPLDLLPDAIPVIGVLDDAAVLWLGYYIFLELCPPAVVEEHRKALSNNSGATKAQDDVIDADATDISDK